jgi:hypothetical protein
LLRCTGNDYGREIKSGSQKLQLAKNLFSLIFVSGVVGENVWTTEKIEN